MKIALVIPRNGADNENNFFDFRFLSKFLFSKKYFGYLLAIPTIAALTPQEHEIKIFDENTDEIDYDWGADLVGISVRTMFAPRAYRISARFKSKGAKTVLGGIHPSMCTEEALQHCDSVVVGEAEQVWSSVLADAENGGLKKIYKTEGQTDMTQSPTPLWSHLSRDKYITDIMQTTKGCPFHCEFCSVYAYDGQRIRNKTVEQVMKEIRGLGGTVFQDKKKSLFIADDNIIANRDFAKKLFTELKKLDIKWDCQASINIAKNDEILGLMKDAGCGTMLIGLETISEENLSQMNKGINLKHDYVAAIKKIQSYGILVNGSFILGYEFDTKSSADDLIAFIEETNLLFPVFNILTPYPGTKLYERFLEEGRIIDKDWSKYDSKNVVYSPAGMTPEELQQDYWKVWRTVYSFDSIYKRLEYYWGIDFWKEFNKSSPIKFRYRVLFAIRIITLLFSTNMERSKFILKILPKVFNRRVRVSRIIILMAYNDYAYRR